MLREFTFTLKQLAAFEPKKRLYEKVINTIATRETRFLFEPSKKKMRELSCFERQTEKEWV